MSTNKEETLRQFCDVTGADESRSKFFLESSNWQLDVSEILVLLPLYCFWLRNNTISVKFYYKFNNKRFVTQFSQRYLLILNTSFAATLCIG